MTICANILEEKKKKMQYNFEIKKTNKKMRLFLIIYTSICFFVFSVVLLMFLKFYFFNEITINTFYIKCIKFWDDFNFLEYFMVFFVIISNIVFIIIIFFKIKNSNKNMDEFFVIRNTNIKKSLLFYHFIANKYMEKMCSDEKVSYEYLQELKSNLIENAIELYYIVKTQQTDELLTIVVRYKKMQKNICRKIQQ